MAQNRGLMSFLLLCCSRESQVPSLYELKVKAHSYIAAADNDSNNTKGHLKI